MLTRSVINCALALLMLASTESEAHSAMMKSSSSSKKQTKKCNATMEGKEGTDEGGSDDD